MEGTRAPLVATCGSGHPGKRRQGWKARGWRDQVVAGDGLFLLSLELNSRPSTDLYSRRPAPFSLISEGSHLIRELGRKQALTRR